MKKLCLLIIVFGLLMVGCTLPGQIDQTDSPPDVVKETEPGSKEIEPTDIPDKIVPGETLTLPPIPTDVPTAELEPTLPLEPTRPILPTPTISDDSLEHLAGGISLVISEINMVNNTTGWAVGGVEDGDIHILRTTDGAASFRDVSPPVENSDTEMNVDAAFLDEKHAWVIYSYGFSQIPDPAIVWRTEDGGATWLPSEPLSSTAPEFYLPDNFVFADDQNGWLLVHVGAGMHKDYIFLYNTKNGGRSWELVFDPYNAYGPHTCSKTGMDFLANGYGVLTLHCMGVRDGAIINTTTKSGVEWTEHILSAPESAPAVFDFGNVCQTHSPQILESGKIIVAVSCESYGDTGYESSGTFQYSLELGADIWESIDYPGGALLYVNETTAYAFSDEIYLSSDGGLTWVKQKEVIWQAEASFIGAEIGWAVVRADGEIALVYTDDSGLKWDIIEPVLVP